MASFEREKQTAADAIARLKADRARAKKSSASLIPVIDGEIKARTAALEAGVAAADEFDRESPLRDRDMARATAARASVGASHEVDPEAVDRQLRDLAVATQIAGARTRRADTLRDLATSQLFRAQKELGAKKSAVDFSERFVGAVLDRDEQRIPALPPPEVLAWVGLELAFDARALYEERAKERAENPSRSFDPPPPISAYDSAVAALWARVNDERERAAKHAEALGALGPATA